MESFEELEPFLKRSKEAPNYNLHYKPERKKCILLEVMV